MNRLSALFLTFMAFATSAFAQSKMEQELHKLDEVVVKGVAKKLVVREDTFIYNADAYKLQRAPPLRNWCANCLALR